MKSTLFLGTGLSLLLFSGCQVALAQLNRPTAVLAPAPGGVPNVISFDGILKDAGGKTVTSVTGVTFLIYKDEQGGAPLWLETQSIEPDATGRYTVRLGSASAHGLPAEVFRSGEARWLAVQIADEVEPPRVLLVAVPYAMKAADAETVGGLPASAFVLATPVASSPASTTTVEGAGASPTSVPPPTSTVTTTTGGTAGRLAMFTTATNIENSILSQSGTTTLNVGGKLNLPAKGKATATGGTNSQPETMVASAYNSGSAAAVAQTFQLQAEPAANNTANPSGTLNLLYGSGTTKPAETGLKINSEGMISFAPGQTYPGAGTVKSVALSAPSSDFTVTGSPVTSSGTLQLNWAVAPTNSNIANAIVKRDANGNFSAGAISTTTRSEFLPAVTGMDNSTLNGQAVVGSSTLGTGVVGYGSTGVKGHGSVGVFGQTDGTGNVTGVWGDGGPGQYSYSTGVYGYSPANNGEGMSAYNGNAGDGILAGVSDTTNGYAGYFVGNVYVDGNLGKAGGSFKIDHPLDPANKYLYHSFVESPDMKNIYDGNVTTDEQGNAVVVLPEWFEALNRDFRYQLTVIGQFAQAIVASEIANHQFRIQTDKPNVKVSWQVTGIRRDAWANSHRIPVEEAKPLLERGFYLHPELFGASEDRRVLWALRPHTMKQWKESRVKYATTPEPLAGPAKP